MPNIVIIRKICIIVYRVVSSTYACSHIAGGSPYRCRKSVPDCERACTSFSWCIGYSRYSTGTTPMCHFMSSVGSCPSDMEGLGNDIPTSSDDLIPSSMPNWNCVAKVFGRI